MFKATRGRRSWLPQRACSCEGWPGAGGSTAAEGLQAGQQTSYGGPGPCFLVWAYAFWQQQAC